MGVLRSLFDNLCILFFISHIPITLLVDSQGVFPRDLYPRFARDMLDDFIRDYNDPLVRIFHSKPFPRHHHRHRHRR
jgi:hypothetical protein